MQDKSMVTFLFANTRCFNRKKVSSKENTASFALSNVEMIVVNAYRKKTKKNWSSLCKTVILVSGVFATRVGFELLTMSSLVQGPC
jgi:hypothetical protein